MNSPRKQSKKETTKINNSQNRSPQTPKQINLSLNPSQENISRNSGQQLYRNLSTVVQYDIDDINSRYHEMDIPEDHNLSSIAEKTLKSSRNPKIVSNNKDKLPKSDKKTNNQLTSQKIDQQSSQLFQQNVKINPTSSVREFMSNQPNYYPKEESPRRPRSFRTKPDLDEEETKPKRKNANKIPGFYSEILSFKDKNHIRINPQSKDVYFEKYIVSLKD